MILYQVGFVEVNQEPRWQIEIWLNKHNYWILARNPDGHRGLIESISYPNLREAQQAARTRARAHHKAQGERASIRWVD